MSRVEPKREPPAGEFPPRWLGPFCRPALLAIALAVLTLAVYLPVRHNGFVDFDDPEYVSTNPHIQGGLTWQAIGWALRNSYSCNWHPLTWVSHMLDVQFFGLQPGPAHLVNLALHTLNSVLLFLALRTLTGALWRSWLVAALFALHPLHVESVAWISERKDVLSTLFFMLTVMAYAAYARGTARLRWVAYGLAVILFALGLMSKPMLVTLPFVLLLLDYWPLGRLFLPGEDGHARRLGKLVLEKTPFFALSIGSSLVTFLVQQEGGAVSATMSFGIRAGNAIISYASYLGQTVWPLDLAVFYPHPGSWPWGAIAAAALLIAAVSAVAAVGSRTRPYLAVGWLWYLGTLVPVIGLVQVGMQSMADRYTYVPLIGVFIAVVWFAADVTSARLSRLSAVIAAGAAVVLLCCSFLTIRQLGYWRSTETLFRRALEVTRDNYVAYYEVGYCLSGKGRVEEEMEYYRKALEINPDYVEALNNMGCALGTQKRFAEALPYYERALRQAPRHAEVHYNFGNALWELGRREEAVQHYQAAVEVKPEHAEAHDKLGAALAMQGRAEAAIPHFERAIRARPGFAAAHIHLANVYALQQRWNDALREYSEGLRLDPSDGPAHYNAANVLFQLGRVAEAAGHYRETLRLQPGNAEAACRLGIALLRQGDHEGAAGSFRQALRLKPDYAEAARQLRALSAP